MKRFSLMMWQGLMLSALALGFASCEPSDKPCPNKKEADGDTSQGVTVMLEMENVDTGETTRTALGENDYSFTPMKGGGDVEVDGLGFRPKQKDSDDIYVNLAYYAKENVVFQGWSWRYSDDRPGIHRGKTDAKINDYVATPALQAKSGVQKLDLDKDATKFTCQYRPNSDNKVYVKVRYARKQMPSLDLVVGCSGIIYQSVDKCVELINLRYSSYLSQDNKVVFNKIFGQMIEIYDKKIKERHRFSSPFHVSLSTPGAISEPVPAYVKDNLLVNLSFHKERLTLYYELMSAFRAVKDNPEYVYALDQYKFREVKKLMLEIEKLSHSGPGLNTIYDIGVRNINGWERFANDLNI